MASAMTMTMTMTMIVRQAGFAISIAALGMTLGTASAAGEFVQSFALAAFVALLGMIAVLALLPAKSLQDCEPG